MLFFERVLGGEGGGVGGREVVAVEVLVWRDYDRYDYMIMTLQ